ncbi:hypothetical protein [Sphingomonas molluscorum]|uniref:hypothetical protein n=1 Tax=Sphingomonas molluscorum TaxID=418184 RepID=UPI0031D6F604
MAARARGHLTPHERMRGDQLVPAFDPEEVADFAHAFRARVTVGTVAYRFGIGRRGVQDIVVCGHMPASGPALVDGEICFTETDVDDLEVRIREAGRSGLHEPVRINEALLAVHGRPKQWGALIGALLAGDLPFLVAEGADTLFGTLAVERSSIPQIGRMVSVPTLDLPLSDRLTRCEALEMLNVEQTCQALSATTSAGRNPITYSLHDVERLARRGVSVLEVATATGRGLSYTYHLMRR